MKQPKILRIQFTHGNCSFELRGDEKVSGALGRLDPPSIQSHLIDAAEYFARNIFSDVRGDEGELIVDLGELK